MTLILGWYMGLETVFSPRVDMLSIRGEKVDCSSNVPVNSAYYCAFLTSLSSVGLYPLGSYPFISAV